MNTNALFGLTYGLYMLSSKYEGKDNACIVNTVMQIANNPTQLMVSVSRSNYTHRIIDETREFNVSVITKQADFELFKRFGLQSGKDVDKFADFSNVKRSKNGLLYLTDASSAFMSVKVTKTVPLSTHTIFIGEMTDADVLSNQEPCTYAYYHSDIKPKPDAGAPKKGWKCNICGYVYEGETLPEDYTCPLCKHGPEDFTKL